MVKKSFGSSKENMELAEEHIKIAEDLVGNEIKKCDPSKKKKMKELGEAAFALEKAESEVEDLEEDIEDIEELDVPGEEKED